MAIALGIAFLMSVKPGGAGVALTAIGVARTFEHMRLGMEDGRLVFTAIPSGQSETAFPATVVSDTILTFENPEHDFPQRITYRRRGVDSLVARIEGPGSNDEIQGFDIPMHRVACTASVSRSRRPITGEGAHRRVVLADRGSERLRLLG